MGKIQKQLLLLVLLWQRTTSPKKEIYIDGSRQANSILH